jgi:NodT family efflux transporter outer membrane factor (OMF) lipoprotein
LTVFSKSCHSNAKVGCWMIYNLRRWIAPALAACTLFATGCTSLHDYLHNGFKVGPNYSPPMAPVADDWIDVTDKRVRSQTDDLAGWWTVFNDPLLNQLMVNAYRQNLTLREAGYRVLAARAQLGIATGNFFPQAQTATGSYDRFGIGNTFFNQWNFGFNLAWELDFWGRFRRAIRSAGANLDASVFDYDDVLVTLLGDTASNYVQARTSQERIRLLQNIIKVQEDVLRFIEERLAAGRGVTELDRAQARSNLKQSMAQLKQLQIDLRTAQNQICILLGMPVIDLSQMLNSGPQTSIPTAPQYVVVGIPADLLRRRPDVRRAERQAAAQAEQIGIAEAAWYPAITISGTLGWQAATFSNLFSPQALNSVVGPSFQWNLLNYGRILNNVRFQDAQFQELVVAYQNTVLNADLEVENGIITFLRAQDRAVDLRESVDEAWIALEVIVAQYQAGLAGVDFNRYATIQQTLVTQQDLWAQSRGQIGQGLVQVYRALGGGWQIRFSLPPEQNPVLSPPAGSPRAGEQMDEPRVEILPAPAMLPPNPPPPVAAPPKP